jgi:hypothetical protein
MDLEVIEAIESLRTDIGRVETSLRAEIGKSRVEMMRHADIRYESLHDDIRILAEGFAWLGAKIDSLT